MRITIAVSECNMRSAGFTFIIIFCCTFILTTETMIEQNDSKTLEEKCCNTNSNVGGFIVDVESQATGFRGENISLPLFYSNNDANSLNITLSIENLTANFENNTSLENPLISREIQSGAINQEYILSIKINDSAIIGQDTLSLKWKIEQNYLWTNITINIKEYSNLLWQFESGSNFIIEQNTSTTFGLELTNNATANENSSISLESTTGWNSTWNLGPNSSNQENIELLPYGKYLIEFTIHVPIVVDGEPLAEYPYPWSLSAKSSLDGTVTWYNFTIEVIPVYNLSIDTAESTFQIDPGSDIRIPITYRNTGNIESEFHVSILPVDQNGNTMQVQEDDRFVFEGWEVAIFGQESDIFLEANESTSLELGVLSPYSVSGNITLQFEVYSYSNTQNIAIIRQHVTIFESNGGSASISEMNCMGLLPGESCTGEISGFNSGNYQEIYELFVIESPNWVQHELSKANVEIYPNQVEQFSTLTITIKNDTNAFTNGNIRLAYTFANNETPLEILEVNISVGETINWTIESKETTIKDGNLTIIYSLINNGNCPDSLVVSVDTSHYGKYGLIPPPSSEWEYESNNIRSFVVRDFPQREYFYIELWMHIPDNQAEDGIAWAEIQIQSLEDEEFNWIDKSETNFKGIESSKDTTIIDFSQLGGDTEYLFNKYGYTVIGILISIVAISWAISVRKKRNPRITNKKIEQIEKTANEWMGKFLPSIKTNGKTNTVSDANVEEIEIATDIIDKHSKIESELEFERLAEDLLISEREIHESNEKLKYKQDSTTMTKRTDPRGILSRIDEDVIQTVEEDDLDL